MIKPATTISLKRFFFILCVFLPTALVAIPSPDALIRGVAGISWLAGSIAALAGIFGFVGFKSGKDKKVRRALITAVALGFVFALLATGFAYKIYRDGTVSKIASEYRCDVGYHSARANAAPLQVEIFNNPVIHAKSFREFRYRMSGVQNPLIIDIRLPFWKDSGYFDFGPEKPIQDIYASELKQKLEHSLKNAPESSPPSLFLLTYRPIFLMYYDDEERVAIADLLKQFRSVVVYLVSDQYAHHDIPEFRGFLKTNTNEEARTQAKLSPFSWPTITDHYLMDGKSVRFPKAEKRLNYHQVARLIRDDETILIFSFSSFYRDALVYKEQFIKLFLSSNIPKSKRIYLIDYSAKDIRKKIQQVVENVSGKPFVVLGIGKFDTLHYGLDTAYQIWKVSLKEERRFLFRGSSDELPSAAAYLDLKRKSEMTDWRLPLNRWLIKALSDFGISVFILGVLLRCLTFPLVFVELRSRFISSDSRFWRKFADIETLPSSWRPKSLAKYLGAKPGIELLSISIFLAITYAIYPTLSALPESVRFSPALILIFLFALDLSFELITPIKLTTPSNLVQPWVIRKILFKILILLALCPIVYIIPTSLSLYLCGSLTVSLIIAGFARRSSWKCLPEGVLGIGQFKSSFSTHSSNEKSKAGRLMALSRFNSALFKVPTAFVYSKSEFDSRVSVSELWSVRSSAGSEDSLTQSSAGKFLSLLAVPSNQVAEAVKRVEQSLSKYPHPDNAVFVHPFVECETTGVLFTQSPESGNLSQLELIKGPLKRLLTDGVHGKKIMAGRYSAEITGGKKHAERIMFIGRLLECYFEGPQDIELGLNNKGVTLFQSRPITTAPLNSSYAAQRFYKLFGENGTAISYEHLTDNHPVSENNGLFYEKIFEKNNLQLVYYKGFLYGPKKRWSPQKGRRKSLQHLANESLEILKEGDQIAETKDEEKVFDFISSRLLPLILSINEADESGHIKRTDLEKNWNPCFRAIAYYYCKSEEDLRKDWAHRKVETDTVQAHQQFKGFPYLNDNGLPKLDTVPASFFAFCLKETLKDVWMRLTDSVGEGSEKKLTKEDLDQKPISELSLVDIEFDQSEQKEGDGVSQWLGEEKSITGYITFDKNSAEGKILAAARLDASLIPYFAKLKGLLVGTGSSLSHAAIVAREMDVPILRIGASLHQLSEGSFVKIDKDGEVEEISE